MIWLLTISLLVLVLDVLFVRAREPSDLPFSACWGLLFTIVRSFASAPAFSTVPVCSSLPHTLLYHCHVHLQPFLRAALPSIPPVGIAFDVRESVLRGVCVQLQLTTPHCQVWVYIPSLMLTAASALLIMSAHLGYSSATRRDRFRRPTKDDSDDSVDNDADVKEQSISEDDNTPDRQNTMDVIASFRSSGPLTPKRRHPRVAED